MIALGGVIGAGLFVGSGAVINQTGPAAVLSYLLAGTLVVFVMRMLGEMAVANPSTGSFADYSRMALGNWAGFTTGWLYWWFWVIVLAIEAVAGAEILQRWFDVPIWLTSLVLMVLLTLTNLASVRSYGEFEFWFASIKVAAIIAFICLGAAYVLGLTGGEAGFGKLTAEGGFAPEGLSMVLTGVVIVIFAFVGAEIATIAAAESDEPREAVTKATNSVIGRVLIFYVLSVFLIVCIVPWNSTQLGESPFVAALDIVGIAGAADIMNAIVLTAVLSCLNSGLYVASRMMFALAHRGDAPQWSIQLNSRGGARTRDPARHVGGLRLGDRRRAVAGDDLPLARQLLRRGRAVVYLLIAVSELRMRARLEREAPERLEVRMWGYPWLTWLVIAAIVVVIASMALVDDVRSQLWWSLGSLAVVLGAYALRARLGGRETPPDRPRRFARADERAASGVGSSGGG